MEYNESASNTKLSQGSAARYGEATPKPTRGPITPLVGGGGSDDRIGAVVSPPYGVQSKPTAIRSELQKGNGKQMSRGSLSYVHSSEFSQKQKKNYKKHDDEITRLTKMLKKEKKEKEKCAAQARAYAREMSKGGTKYVATGGWKGYGGSYKCQKPMSLAHVARFMDDPSYDPDITEIELIRSGVEENPGPHGRVCHSGNGAPFRTISPKERKMSCWRALCDRKHPSQPCNDRSGCLVVRHVRCLRTKFHEHDCAPGRCFPDGGVLSFDSGDGVLMTIPIKHGPVCMHEAIAAETFTTPLPTPSPDAYSAKSSSSASTSARSSSPASTPPATPVPEYASIAIPLAPELDKPAVIYEGPLYPSLRPDDGLVRPNSAPPGPPPGPVPPPPPPPKKPVKPPNKIKRDEELSHAVDGPSFQRKKQVWLKRILRTLQTVAPWSLDRSCVRHDSINEPPSEDIRPSMYTSGKLREMHGKKAPFYTSEYRFDYKASRPATFVATLGASLFSGLGAVALSAPFSAVVLTAALTSFVAATFLRNASCSVSFNAVPDWLTSLFMTCNSAEDIRANGLRRVGLSSSLNIHSGAWAYLAHQTVECAVFAHEMDFGLAPSLRGDDGANL